MSGRAEMTRQFAQGLIAELHSAEADRRIALFLGRVELAQGDYGLAVALYVECHDDMEARGIFVLVGAVLDLDQPRRFYPQKYHAVVPTPAIGARVDEAPAPADADIALQRVNRESVGPEPLHDLLRVGPCLEDALARRGDHTAQHDLAIKRPGSAGVSVHGRHLSSLPLSRNRSRRSKRASQGARVWSNQRAVSAKRSTFSRHGRFCPSRPRAMRPARSSTFRCCDTAGRLIAKGAAISCTVRSPWVARRLRMASRVGSPSAANVWVRD